MRDVKGFAIGLVPAIMAGAVGVVASNRVSNSTSNSKITNGVVNAGVAEAYNVANASKLANQLTLESARSSFDVMGALTQDAINGAKAIKYLDPGQLSNPAIPPGFGKYTTETFSSPAGDFQTHFYMNPATGETFYGLDCKTIFNNKSGVPKTP